MPEHIRADRNLQAVEKFARLFMAITDGGNGVEDHNRRLVTGESQYLLGVRDGFKVVGLRPARDQHEVGGFRGSKGRLLGPCRGVNDGKIHAVLFGLFKGGGKPGGLRIDDDGAVGFPAVLPVAGGGLGIEIDDNRAVRPTWPAATARDTARVVLPVPPFCAMSAIVYMSAFLI